MPDYLWITRRILGSSQPRQPLIDWLWQTFDADSFNVIRVPIMRDLHADWKKWSSFERVSALAGVLIMVLAVPFLTASAFLTH